MTPTVPPLTDEDLGRLAKAEARATAAPWSRTSPPTPTGETFASGVLVAATAPGKGNRIYADPPGGSFPSNDADFIVAARNNFRALLSEITTTRAERDEARPYKDELLKIAEDVGEADDPFAAWESVAALKARAGSLAAENERLKAALGDLRERFWTILQENKDEEGAIDEHGFFAELLVIEIDAALSAGEPG